MNALFLNIFTENPVAAMKGPVFLVFYAIFCVLVLTGFYLLKHYSDTSLTAGELPPVTDDPLTISYLRLGIRGYIETIVFKLMQAGRIKTKNNQYVPAERTDEVALPPPSPEEKIALRHLKHPVKVMNFYTNKSFYDDMTKLTERKQEQFEKLELLTSAARKNFLLILTITCMFIVLSMGAYKLGMAIYHGRSNVAYLMLMMIASGFSAYYLMRPPRLTRKGKKYLESIQNAFSGVKQKLHNEGKTMAPDSGDFTLAMCLFGMTALSGTVHHDYYQTVMPASMAGSGGDTGGGSSDGGGGCSSGCGGGCGGCGS